jgi:type IV pilus modification protein PilV
MPAIEHCNAPDNAATPRRQQPLARTAGLTVIETLVALLMLGIGILCIAAVYLERSQAAPAVLLHTKAKRLAAELGDALRSGQFAQLRIDNPVGVVCMPHSSNSRKKGEVANLIACWQKKVGSTLPNGSGTLGFDAGSLPPARVITVSWSPPTGGTASYQLRLEQVQPVKASDAARAAN